MQQSTRGNYRDLWRQLVILAAIFGAFVINVVSNIFPLNGLNIGEISNTLFKNVLIIPANYAFAIWGLIYLGLFAFGVYQALPNQRHEPDLRKTGYLLVIACVAQSIWVYLFLSRLFAISVIAMLLILLPLIGVYVQLEIGKSRVPRLKRWCIHFPISIYLGWISVATIVNVACALDFHGWNGWGISAVIWTLIMVFIATAVAVVMVIQRRDIAYTGVTVWALVAIALKHFDNSMLRNTVFILAIFLVLTATINRLRTQQEHIEV